MAATATSFHQVQRILNEFIRVLNYAACEWILIFLLFIDAAFAYMLTSFAQYCGLQIPCMICSRLDHVFGEVKDGYYRALLCRNHRSELSFLLSCNIHDKLVDGRGMCDDCLSSHIEVLKSDSDMRGLFDGNLEYYGSCSAQSSVLNRVIRLCLCCDKPWASRPGSNRLLLLKSSGLTEKKPNIPFSRALSLNDLKKKKKKMRNMNCASAESHVGDTNEKYEPKKLLNANESLEDYPSSSGLVKVPRSSASLLADLNSQVDTSSSVNAKHVPLQKTESISATSNDEIMKAIDRNWIASEFVTKYMLAHTSGDKGDLNISDGALNGKEKSASEFDAKNNVVNEDLKPLPAQNSSGEGNQLSLNYLSPELQDRAVELQRTDSNSAEVLNLQNLFFEAISEPPGLKPFDESGDIEGESLVDKLKRQVDNAREYINSLTKDLDEERNASAIAAYQAMAMITKLQEEKAALRIEALQYLRMMEEQVEYDVHALEEKEKQLQDLQADLQYYRSNFPCAIPEGTKPGSNIDSNKEHVPTVNTTTVRFKQHGIENVSHTESPKTTICPNNIINNISETEFPEAIVVDDQPVIITAWSEIEDEKLFISQLLQKLERKLSRLSQYEASRDTSDSENSDSDDEKDRKRVHEASSKANGTGPSQETLSTSTSKDELAGKENGDTFSNGEDDDGESCRGNGLEALENEISEFNERLEALEADCSFLHRSLNSLKNGKEGLLLIQEILHLLREVRKIGLKTMDPSVTVL